VVVLANPLDVESSGVEAGFVALKEMAGYVEIDQKGESGIREIDQFIGHIPEQQKIHQEEQGHGIKGDHDIGEKPPFFPFPVALEKQGRHESGKNQKQAAVEKQLVESPGQSRPPVASIEINYDKKADEKEDNRTDSGYKSSQISFPTPDFEEREKVTGRSVYKGGNDKTDRYQGKERESLGSRTEKAIELFSIEIIDKGYKQKEEKRHQQTEKPEDDFIPRSEIENHTEQGQGKDQGEVEDEHKLA